MKRLEISMLLALLFTFVVGMTAFERECGEIRESVLRMHIVANSDSQEDQQLKLKVRDRLLEESEQLFENAVTREDAIAAAGEAIELLEQSAIEEIRAQGFDYDVEIEIGPAWFDTRTYGDITLPAGCYEAINLYIGQGEGKNWWCVMFPQLCLPAASGDELSSVLTDEQNNIVESGYEVEFYIVELWESLMAKISGK